MKKKLKQKKLRQKKIKTKKKKNKKKLRQKKIKTKVPTMHLSTEEQKKKRFPTTIVSAFINIDSKYRNVDKYVAYGKEFMKIQVPKVIFLDKKVFLEHFAENAELQADPFTKIIPVEKESLFLFPHLHECTNVDKTFWNQSKDSLEYMFVQNNKLEWLREAIEVNFFETSQFVWIDFGISHLFNNDSICFQNAVQNLALKEYDNVRVAGIWDLSLTFREIFPKYTGTHNVLQNVQWYFAGGVIGGHKSALLHFADLVKKKCFFVITEFQLMVWEVNIWYLVYLDLKQENQTKHIDWFSSNHNESILLNY